MIFSFSDILQLSLLEENSLPSYQSICISTNHDSIQLQHIENGPQVLKQLEEIWTTYYKPMTSDVIPQPSRESSFLKENQFKSLPGKEEDKVFEGEVSCECGYDHGNEMDIINQVFSISVDGLNEILFGDPYQFMEPFLKSRQHDGKDMMIRIID
jgi:hypothetical protein